MEGRAKNKGFLVTITGNGDDPTPVLKDFLCLKNFSGSFSPFCKIRLLNRVPMPRYRLIDQTLWCGERFGIG